MTDRHGDEESKREAKWDLVYTKPWRLKLDSGDDAWVEHLDMLAVYGGAIEGLPPSSFIDSVMASARKDALKKMHGLEPVIIAPEIHDPDSANPILPPVRFMANIVSYRKLESGSHGSWMTLVWFAERDDANPLMAFVREAVEKVDWDASASSYML